MGLELCPVVVPTDAGLEVGCCVRLKCATDLLVPGGWWEGRVVVYESSTAVATSPCPLTECITPLHVNWGERPVDYTRFSAFSFVPDGEVPAASR